MRAGVEIAFFFSQNTFLFRRRFEPNTPCHLLSEVALLPNSSQWKSSSVARASIIAISLSKIFFFATSQAHLLKMYIYIYIPRVDTDFRAGCNASGGSIDWFIRDRVLALCSENSCVETLPTAFCFGEAS